MPANTFSIHARPFRAVITEQKVTRRLKSVSQFASEQPFTEPQIRWWIFQSERNGLASAGAVVRLGPVSISIQMGLIVG